MMSTRPSSFVSELRLWQHHVDMARFGATAAGGVNRQALSAEDVAAQAEQVRWGDALGLVPSRDAVGNLFLRMAGSNPAAAPVLSGSHLDSQPTGGRFDGVYGVLVAFEAVQAICETAMVPVHTIEIVAWMNEEGSRFAPGMMGSAVFASARTLEETSTAVDAAGIRVGDALKDVATQLANIPQRPLGGQVHAYVETHIEQGPVLEREGFQVGIVTGIQGKHTFRVEVVGEAAHAGTSQRHERKDALLTAAAMVQALAAEMHDGKDIVKFPIGRFEVRPNAPSVVASKVVFTIDLRHPSSDTLRALSARIAPICEAQQGSCTVRVQRLPAADSLHFPETLRAQARAVADRLGITHNEAESADPADLAAGARVLADLLLELAA